MSLLAKLKKTSSVKEASSLEDSPYFDTFDDTPCSVPIMNIILSGALDGGIRRGLTTINGQSRMFKSLQALIMVSAYMKKYPDSVCLFFDSEFGAGKKYFETCEIDPNRVLHIPVVDIETMTNEIMMQLDALEKTEKIIIFVDSIGGLGSRKEATDALSGHEAQDMTRAKKLKSLSRLLPVRLVMKDVPMIAINHTYEEQKLYGKTIISGGQGIMLASEVALIVTRSQEKEEKEVVGYNFNIKCEKSRWVKEASKVTLEVRFDGGVNIYSGLLEIALESKHVTKPKPGWFQRVDPDTGEVLSSKMYREAETNCEEFMRPIINDAGFKQFVIEKFQLAHGSLLVDNSIESEDE